MVSILETIVLCGAIACLWMVGISIWRIRAGQYVYHWMAAWAVLLVDGFNMALNTARALVVHSWPAMVIAWVWGLATIGAIYVLMRGRQ